MIEIEQIKKRDTNNQQTENSEDENDSFILLDQKNSNYNELDDKYKKKEQQKKIINEIPYSIYITILKLIFAYCFFAVFIFSECSTEEFPSDDECIEGVLVPYIKVWVVSIFLSASLIYSTFMLSLWGYYNKYSKYLAICMTIYLGHFHYGPISIQSISLRNYKSGQTLFLILYIVVFFLSHLTLIIVRYMYKNYRKLMYAIGIIGFIATIKIFLILSSSCDGWEYGLASKLDNSEEYCHIKEPGVCWPNIIDNWFNFGPYTCEFDRENEKLRKKNVHNILQSYKLINPKENQKKIQFTLQNYKYLAWPLTKEFNPNERTREASMIEQIIQNKKHYNDLEAAFDDDREIVIDIQNQYMYINVKRNETLIEERQKRAEQIKNLDPVSDNIIVIYIDTVSRAQTFRKLKKSMKFLEKYAKYNSTEYSEQNYDKKVYEYFRYHSIDRKTLDNVFKFQYNTVQADYQTGRKKLDLKEKVRSIFSDIKDAGYITSHATNSLSLKSVFRGQKYHNNPLYSYFEDIPADHEFFNFDPNYIMQRNTFGITKGSNSMYRRCLYGNDTNYYVFDYGKKFLDQYRDQKKFLYLEFTDGHEITSEVVQYVDDNLYNFLTDIEKSGHLKQNTMVYLLSDHGQHMYSAFQVFQKYQMFSNNDVYQIERMLPFFYVMATNDVLEKNKEVEKSLQENQQTIFGMKNFRDTILTNVYGTHNKTNQDNSLFNTLGKERSCLDIEMAPFKEPQFFCSCLPSENYPFIKQDFYKQYKEVYNATY